MQFKIQRKIFKGFKLLFPIFMCWFYPSDIHRIQNKKTTLERQNSGNYNEKGYILLIYQFKKENSKPNDKEK